MLASLHTTSNTKQAFTYWVNELALEESEYFPEKIEAYFFEAPSELLKIEIVDNFPGHLTKLNLWEELREETLEMIHITYVGFPLIYTEGSVNLNAGKAAAGFYNQESGETCYILASWRSSINTYLLAIKLTSCINKYCKSICILTDSRFALQSLHNYIPSNYAFRITGIQTLLKKLQSIENKVVLMWIPLLCGVLDNETADEIPKEALRWLSVQLPKYSLAKCKRQSS